MTNKHDFSKPKRPSPLRIVTILHGTSSLRPVSHLTQASPSRSVTDPHVGLAPMDNSKRNENRSGASDFYQLEP